MQICAHTNARLSELRLQAAIGGIALKPCNSHRSTSPSRLPPLKRSAPPATNESIPGSAPSSSAQSAEDMSFMTFLNCCKAPENSSPTHEKIVDVASIAPCEAAAGSPNPSKAAAPRCRLVRVLAQRGDPRKGLPGGGLLFKAAMPFAFCC